MARKGFWKTSLVLPSWTISLLWSWRSMEIMGRGTQTPPNNPLAVPLRSPPSPNEETASVPCWRLNHRAYLFFNYFSMCCACVRFCVILSCTQIHVITTTFKAQNSPPSAYTFVFAQPFLWVWCMNESVRKTTPRGCASRHHAPCSESLMPMVQITQSSLALQPWH